MAEFHWHHRSRKFQLLSIHFGSGVYIPTAAAVGSVYLVGVDGESVVEPVRCTVRLSFWQYFSNVGRIFVAFQNSICELMEIKRFFCKFKEDNDGRGC